MIKVQCYDCGWKGDLRTCGEIASFDAARCPHCNHEVIAYALLARFREERSRQKWVGVEEYTNYRTPGFEPVNGFVQNGRHLNGVR